MKSKTMKRAIRKNKSQENKFDCELHRLQKKTENLNAMKTKNNVQKTLLRWAAVFVSFVLISFTVSAQDFWKRIIENSSFGNIAMAMVDTKDIPVENTTSRTFDFVNEPETGMEIESWMTSELTFAVPAFNFPAETESELVPESWMFDEVVFLPETTGESALQLEDWMVSEKVWKM